MYYTNQYELHSPVDPIAGWTRLSVINGTNYGLKTTKSKSFLPELSYTYYAKRIPYSNLKSTKYPYLSGSVPGKCDLFKPYNSFKVAYTPPSSSYDNYVRTVTGPYGFHTTTFLKPLSPRVQYIIADMERDTDMWKTRYVGYTSGGEVTLAHLSTWSLQAMKGLLTDSRLLNSEQLNVGTFIGELRELKQLSGLWKFKKNHLDISDKFLGVQFGVLPLVSELTGMYSTFKALPNAINQWNRMAKKEETRAYHDTVLDDSKEFKKVYVDTYTNGPTFETTVEVKQRLVRRAHIFVRPKQVDTNFNSALSASILGFNKPFGVAWNLMPMSFFADWFVRIDKVIEDFEYTKPTLDFDIVSAGTSAKLLTEVNISVKARAYGDLVYIDRGSCSYNIEEYGRYSLPLANLLDNIVKSKLSPLEIGQSWNGFKWTITAALIHQRAYS